MFLNMQYSVEQLNTIEHEERYYRRVRQGLQTATQTRLDIQQQACRSLQLHAQRTMKHCNSDEILLLHHDLTAAAKPTSFIDSPSRQQITPTRSPTSTHVDDRVCV